MGKGPEGDGNGAKGEWRRCQREVAEAPVCCGLLRHDVQDADDIDVLLGIAHGVIPPICIDAGIIQNRAFRMCE